MNKMDIEIINIPKDKFDFIQGDVLRVLIKYGLVNINSIPLIDLNDNFIGMQLEIEQTKYKIGVKL